MAIPRQNAIRLGPKEVSFPIGKTLYHGTVKKLSSGFPNRPSGNWFATHPKQSILHALQAAGGSNMKIPYMYIYKVIKSPKLIRFSSSVNFNRFAKSQGFELPEGSNTFAFSTLNYQVAKKLCENGTYDGWWFPRRSDPSNVVQPIQVPQVCKGPRD